MHPRTKYLLLIISGFLVSTGGFVLFVIALVVFWDNFVLKLSAAVLGVLLVLAGVWPFAEGMDQWHEARRKAWFHEQFGSSNKA